MMGTITYTEIEREHNIPHVRFRHHFNLKLYIHSILFSEL